MTIHSNPPGALVYVDDYELGTTPISTNFTYYGKRKIRLVKDGYETKTVMQQVLPPWYQYFPLDFLTENFVPGEIRDTRTLTFNLTPQAIAPTDSVMGRAEQLRRGIHQETGTTPAAVRITPGPSMSQPGPMTPAPMTPVPQAMPTFPAAPSTPVDPHSLTPGMGGQPIYPLPPGAR